MLYCSFPSQYSAQLLFKPLDAFLYNCSQCNGWERGMDPVPVTVIKPWRAISGTSDFCETMMEVKMIAIYYSYMYISMGGSNTIVSAYTKYRHLR